MRARIVALSAVFAFAAVLTAPVVASADEIPVHVLPAALPADDCKLESPLPDFNEGFALDANGAPATGELTVQVLYMDFLDHAGGGEGDRTIEQIRAQIASGIENLETQSAGRLEVTVREHPERLTFPHPVSHYAETEHTIWSYEELAVFVSDAVTVADPIVDFRGIDVVWVVSPWVFPLAWYNQASNTLDIEADGISITRAVTSPTGSDSDLRALVVHETGHSFGLPDLYDTSDVGNARFIGAWDPMSASIGTSAGEFMGWHLWRLGWIDDDQVNCLSPAARLDLELDALTLRGDSVIAVIPTAASRAIVVESRRALRYDSEITRPGVLVYLVYTTDSTGAVLVGARDGTEFPTDPEGFANATLRLGERYTDWASGLTITVVASSADSDTVRFGSIDDPTEPPVDPETDPPVDETPGAVPASSEHPGSTLPATGVAADAAWSATLALCMVGMIALALSAFRRPAHRDGSDRR